MNRREHGRLVGNVASRIAKTGSFTCVCGRKHPKDEMIECLCGRLWENSITGPRLVVKAPRSTSMPCLAHVLMADVGEDTVDLSEYDCPGFLLC